MDERKNHSAWWYAEQKGVPVEAATSDDPDLWMVFADPNAYMDAHPCTCEEDGEPCQNCK